MNKEYKLLEPINNFRIIDLFIDSPRDNLGGIEVVKRLRPYTSKSAIDASLEALSKAKLLNKTKKFRKNKYKISSRSDSFREIFNGYRLFKPERLERLLKSDYANYVIRKRGFKKIHEIIKQEFHDHKFRQVTSVLLNLSAVHEEYKQFADDLHETISRVEIKEVGDPFARKQKNDELFEIGKELIPAEIDEIDLLTDFEPATAVRFYRNHIHESVVAGLGKLKDRSLISEGLHDFLVFDNYLSPLSSYPVNGTLQLLFVQPFQRIYDDIYLLDGEAFELMSSRAAVIYKYFPDILFEFFRNSQLDEKSVRIRIKEMIYSWNVSSTRFDLICDQFTRLYRENENYHLGTDGLNYRITELDNISRKLLPEHVSRSILIEGSGPLIFEELNATKFKVKPMEDPFTKLRPCLVFRDMNFGNDFISIEEIAKELKIKLSRYSKES